MSFIKDMYKNVIDRLPDDCTEDQIKEELLFVIMARRAMAGFIPAIDLDDLNNERIISNKEIQQRIEKWTQTQTIDTCTDYELVWTTEATDRLWKIYEGLESKDPKMAASVVNGLFTKTQALLVAPEKGCPMECMPDRNVRSAFIYGHYRVAYEILALRYIVILGVCLATC